MPSERETAERFYSHKAVVLEVKIKTYLECWVTPTTPSNCGCIDCNAPEKVVQEYDRLCRELNSVSEALVTHCGWTFGNVRTYVDQYAVTPYVMPVIEREQLEHDVLSIWFEFECFVMHKNNKKK